MWPHALQPARRPTASPPYRGRRTDPGQLLGRDGLDDHVGTGPAVGSGMPSEGSFSSKHASNDAHG